MVNLFYLDRDTDRCARYYCDRHIVKIPIEIAQILSKIHHILKTDINYEKIYKNSSVVKPTLGPYRWTLESLDNYTWTCKLGISLINEYKFRYGKEEHKTEKILIHLLENPPTIPQKGPTRFILTNKVDMFQYISEDPVVCARYNYAELKCNNDKWSKRKPPEWYIDLKKKIKKKKEKLIQKILDQVKERLPATAHLNGTSVYRYHSFLRVAYDHLFQGKWDVRAKLMNRYDAKKPILYQFTFPQLFFIHKITKMLENKKTLELLNIQSLKYRNKLKFPNKKINYRDDPQYYVYTNTEEGALIVEPYKSIIFPHLKFKPIDAAKESCDHIYNLFKTYIDRDDMIGADMARKYIQMGVAETSEYEDGDKMYEKSMLISSQLFIEKLDLIYSNKLYLKWIDSFKWKDQEPFKPTSYIL